MSIRSYFENIAEAIKEKNPDVITVAPSEMPDAILNIQTGTIGEIPEILYCGQFNGSSAGNKITYTATEKIKGTLFIAWVCGETAVKNFTNLSVKINNNSISIGSTYPGTNNNVRANIGYSLIEMDVNDILTVETLTGFPSTGIIITIIKGDYTFNLFNSYANNNRTFPITNNDGLILQIAKFGFYGNANTLAAYGFIKITDIELSNDMISLYGSPTLSVNSIATPNDYAYYYGGTMALTVGKPITPENFQITVIGGYNGGAPIVIKINNEILFTSVGNSPYNLVYTPTDGIIHTTIGNIVITITPPANNTGKLIIELSGAITFNTNEISPEGSNTSYGYNYDSGVIDV